MAAPASDLRCLPDGPSDGITDLRYFTDANDVELLASTSWDGSLRIHNTDKATNKLMCQQNMDAGPLLSLSSCPSGKSLFVGGLDGSVRKLDIEKSIVSTIGYHSSEDMDTDTDMTSTACSCLVSLSFDDETSTTIVASAGWDSTFYLWDVENTNANVDTVAKPIATIKLPDKAFSMDVDPSRGNRIAIATSGRRLCIIDVTRTRTISGNDENNDNKYTYEAKMVMDRESSLKYQSRVCRFFPNGVGLAVGSIEGRVAVEFLNELDVDSNGVKRYAFKCHRAESTVYPVNAIAFHPTFGTFATGGCDGGTVTWDGLHKKKLTILPSVPSSVAALAFNGKGNELAIASSYTFEEGERGDGMGIGGAGKDEIYVRSMEDVEVQPKKK